MQLLRVVFLVVHIIAAGMLIAQLPVALYFRRSLKRAVGTPGEVAIMGTMGQTLAGLGSTGGILILLSGLGLIAVNGWGFLGVPGPTPIWLLLKQIIYIVILVLVMAVIVPAGKRKAAVLVAAAQTGQPVTPELRATFSANERISILINVLVFVNVILAVWKPS